MTLPFFSKLVYTYTYTVETHEQETFLGTSRHETDGEIHEPARAQAYNDNSRSTSIQDLYGIWNAGVGVRVLSA